MSVVCSFSFSFHVCCTLMCISYMLYVMLPCLPCHMCSVLLSRLRILSSMQIATSVASVSIRCLWFHVFLCIMDFLSASDSLQFSVVFLGGFCSAGLSDWCWSHSVSCLPRFWSAGQCLIIWVESVCLCLGLCLCLFFILGRVNASSVCVARLPQSLLELCTIMSSWLPCNRLLLLSPTMEHGYCTNSVAS